MDAGKRAPKAPTTPTISLGVEVTKRKSMRGRILAYVAKLGQIDAEGPTAKAAREALAAKVAQLCNEGADPEVRIDPADGHAWVAYRATWGDWGYAHFRPDGGPLGRTRYGGGTVGIGRREETVAAMRRHMAQLYPEAAVEPAKDAG
jgi:hypothetical protein